MWKGCQDREIGEVRKASKQRTKALVGFVATGEWKEVSSSIHKIQYDLKAKNLWNPWTT